MPEIMFQMISIWNWQHVPSKKADQSEICKNNQWIDLLVEQQRSLVLFHMLSDWHFKHLINFILIPRFDPSFNTSWCLTSFIYINAETILSNTICVGTVIDQHWILTSATCGKRDDIVTITFNDNSIFYNDQHQNEIISTIFHIHQDFDACLIRTTDISNMMTHIPCLIEVKFQWFIAVVRQILT